MSKRQTPPVSPPAAGDDRRVAPRFKADDVPWIVSVQPLAGTPGRLVDISSTGILLESRVRMMPHRKNAILIETDDEQKERIDAMVVRTQIVAIPRGHDPVYRCALTFPKGFSSRLQEKVAAAFLAAVPVVDDVPTVVSPGLPLAAAPVAEEPHLAGPFDALWATESGSQVTEAMRVSETSCVVRAAGTLAPGQWASVRIFFSPSRHLLLTGRVAGTDVHGQVTLRFEPLTADDRRALQLELSGQAVDARPAPPLVAVVEPRVVIARPSPRVRAASAHANAW